MKFNNLRFLKGGGNQNRRQRLAKNDYTVDLSPKALSVLLTVYRDHHFCSKYLDFHSGTRRWNFVVGSSEEVHRLVKRNDTKSWQTFFFERRIRSSWKVYYFKSHVILVMRETERLWTWKCCYSTAVMGKRIISYSHLQLDRNITESFFSCTV